MKFHVPWDVLSKSTAFVNTSGVTESYVLTKSKYNKRIAVPNTGRIGGMGQDGLATAAGVVNTYT